MQKEKPLGKVTALTEKDCCFGLEFGEDFSFKFSENDGKLFIEPVVKDKAYNFLKVILPKEEKEAVYGCGEQFSYLNLEGRKVPMWTQEPGVIKKSGIKQVFLQSLLGVGGYWWTNYYPQATLIRSLILQNKIQ
jgi:alpha-glucosidase